MSGGDEPVLTTPAVRAGDGAADLDINEISARTGQTVRNLRAYLRSGVLHPAEKRGRSLWFDHSHVRRIKEVERLRERGYSLAAIADLLSDGTSPLPNDDLAVARDPVRRWHDATEPAWTTDEVRRLLPGIAGDELGQALDALDALVRELATSADGAELDPDLVPTLVLVLGATLARHVGPPADRRSG